MAQLDHGDYFIGFFLNENKKIMSDPSPSMHRPNSQSGPDRLARNSIALGQWQWEEELHRSLGREEWASKEGE